MLCQCLKLPIYYLPISFSLEIHFLPIAHANFYVTPTKVSSSINGSIFVVQIVKPLHAHNKSPTMHKHGAVPGSLWTYCILQMN